MADATLPGLLSLASHELRGPAGVIRGYLKLIEQDVTLGERTRRAVAEATQTVARLAALLDEVSELGRYKQGGVRLAAKSISMRSVLAQAVQAAVLPSADVTLDVVAPADVRVKADEARLRSVFQALIIAVARAQNGPTMVELTLAPPRTKGGTSQVIVAVPTIGRAPVIEKALDLTRGGVGLSLPIAESIVAAHGGTLRERWQGGKWAGFIVRL